MQIPVVLTKRSCEKHGMVIEFFDDGSKTQEKFSKLSKNLEESHTFLNWFLYLQCTCSTSIFGGVSDNKITAIAGAEATGKTFFAFLSVIIL